MPFARDQVVPDPRRDDRCTDAQAEHGAEVDSTLRDREILAAGAGPCEHVSEAAHPPRYRTALHFVWEVGEDEVVHGVFVGAHGEDRAVEVEGGQFWEALCERLHEVGMDDALRAA